MRRTDQPAEEWARAAQFPHPVRWGEVEDQVLARRPRTEDTSADKVIRGIGFVLVTLLAIPTIGSSVVGLALVMAGGDPLIVRILFVLAIGVPLSVLLIWWEDRDRGPVKILVAGGSAAVSLAAYLAMRSAPEANRDAWAELFMIAAAVMGAVVVAVVLIAAKPSDGRPRRRRWSLSPGKDLGYLKAREDVLQIIVERNLADLHPDMQKKMAEMQLGTWHTLDEPSKR